MTVTVAERISRIWRSRSAERQTSEPPDAGWQRPLEALEARVRHLEALLEGFQDAVHRRAVQQDKQIAELSRRTEPDQIARDLSEDARKRGL
jgi:hypothetical protein